MQVLKDYKTSFYKAGLVPAANVYFSMGSEEAKRQGESCLRKEVLAVEGPAPCDRGLSQQQQERAARPAQVWWATRSCPVGQMLPKGKHAQQGMHLAWPKIRLCSQLRPVNGTESCILCQSADSAAR